MRSQASRRLAFELKRGNLLLESVAADVVEDVFHVKTSDEYDGSYDSIAEAQRVTLVKWSDFEEQTSAVDSATAGSSPVSASDGSSHSHSHSDVRKVADIAFAAHVERHVRTSALRQLSEFLGGDKLLLETSDESWCLWLAGRVLALLAEGEDGNEDGGCGSPTLAARLLFLLVGKVSAVRKALFLPRATTRTSSGQRNDDSNRLSVAPVLSILLFPFRGRNFQLFSMELRRLCAEILWQWVAAADSWIDPGEEGLASGLSLTWESGSAVSRVCLPVPVFVSSRLLCVSRRVAGVNDSVPRSTLLVQLVKAQLVFKSSANDDDVATRSRSEVRAYEEALRREIMSVEFGNCESSGPADVRDR